MCIDFPVSVFLLFFFKQKTAYEMRISDWSSDVCSSDLKRNRVSAAIQAHQSIEHAVEPGMALHAVARARAHGIALGRRQTGSGKQCRAQSGAVAGVEQPAVDMVANNFRSEEHTSELQ